MTGFVEREWTSRDGLRLHARDYAGIGGACRLPVFCLHGLTRNGRDFEEIAPHIAASGRRVVVPDMRGRGLSARDPNPDNYAPKVYARDVLALMDALGIGRAVFIGTSMGGLVTMALSAFRGRAIAAAVLNDVGPEVGQSGLDRILSYTGKPVEIRTWKDAADYIRGINSVAFPHYGDADWDQFARRTFREKDGRPVLDYDPAIAIPMAQGQVKNRSLMASFLFRRLARKRPTLLIRGALSDLNTQAIAERMQKAAPALQVAVVPDVGHAPTLSEPAAIKAIDDFLASVP